MACLVAYVYVNVREMEATATAKSAPKNSKGVRGRSPALSALQVPASPRGNNKKFVPMTPHA